MADRQNVYKFELNVIASTRGKLLRYRFSKKETERNVDI